MVFLIRTNVSFRYILTARHLFDYPEGKPVDFGIMGRTPAAMAMGFPGAPAPAGVYNVVAMR